jgi:hypothetical protein
MAPIVRGSEARFRHKKTAAIEAAVSSASWNSLHFYTEDFDSGEGLVDDDELGGDRHNLVDPTQPASALPSPTGGLSVPFDLNQVGHWLASMWGAATVTGSGPYSHVWTSASLAPGLVHLELPFTTGKFKAVDSHAVSQIGCNLQDEDGFRVLTLGMVGRSVRMLPTTVSSSQVAPPARAKVPASKGLLKINGVNFGNVLGGSWTMASAAFSERYMDDSEWPGAVEIGRPSFNCTPEVRYRSDFDHSLFDGLTPFALELLYQLTADLFLKIEVAQAVAPKVVPKANGVGAMSISPAIMGFQKVTTTTAPQLTITLRNGIASY